MYLYLSPAGRKKRLPPKAGAIICYKLHFGGKGSEKHADSLNEIAEKRRDALEEIELGLVLAAGFAAAVILLKQLTGGRVNGAVFGNSERDFGKVGADTAYLLLFIHPEFTAAGNMVCSSV